MNRTWEMIGAPYDLSANDIGASAAPAFVRARCCGERWRGRLKDSWEISLLDGGDVQFDPSEDDSDPVWNLSQFCTALHHRVLNSFASGSTPIVIGGDHSISVGSIAAAATHLATVNPSGKLGVLWCDSHADLGTRDGGNLHGRAAAILLGLGPDPLTGLGGFSPKVRPEHLIQIGVQDLMPSEYQVIRDRRLLVHPMHEVDRRGLRDVLSSAMASLESQTDAIYISVDIDVCQGELFGACASPEIGGLSAREFYAIAEVASRSEKLCGLDLVEFCPSKDVNGHTERLVRRFLNTLVGYSDFFKGEGPTTH